MHCIYGTNSIEPNGFASTDADDISCEDTRDVNSMGSNVEEQAARWLARWESGEMSETDQADLESWISASPAHQEMFEDMQRTWAQMGLIANIVPEAALEHDRDPDILVRTLERLVLFRSTSPIVVIAISVVAILMFIG